jgi:hypothetical protein
MTIVARSAWIVRIVSLLVRGRGSWAGAQLKRIALGAAKIS